MEPSESTAIPLGEALDIQETTITTTVEDRWESNANSPISKLNDDILSCIFMLNTQVDFDPPHCIPSVTIRHTSQVYQRWRDLIINYPIIWAASLDFDDPMAWIEVVLSRAGEVPLDILLPSITRLLPFVSGGDPENWQWYLPTPTNLHRQYNSLPSDHDFDFAVSLLPRSRRFTVTVGSERQFHLLETQLNRTMTPHLQELTLAGYPQPDIFRLQREEDPGMDDSLPRNNRESYHPQLKTLSTSGYGLNLMSSDFVNLTSLSVFRVFYNSVLKAEMWLRALARMPQLEELDLSITSPEVNSVTEEPHNSALTGPVALTKLRSLRLKGDCDPCHKILSGLQFPGSCAMDVHYDRIPHSGHSFFSSMASELSVKLQSSVESLKLTGISLEIASWDRLRLTNAEYTPGDRLLSISWSTSATYLANLQPAFMDILRIISLDIDDLYLRLGSSNVPVASVLEQFGQVQILRLANVYSLEAIIKLHHNYTSSNLILPNLSTLCLYTLYFQTEASVLDVVNLLHRRSEMELPVKSIEIMGCIGSHVGTLMFALDSMGVEIVWDGKFEP